MAEQDLRVETMFRRDCAAATVSVVAVWAVYLFIFWRMSDQFAATGVTLLMLVLGGLVLLLNTAAAIALVRHYQEDKAAIYGTDIYYLDRIAAEKRAAR
jgi:Co/Zn/Cd efflux system component